jgi:DNA-3-methyladenine glycosylase I
VTGAVVGSDGRARCGWGLTDPLYLAYHDEEWGRPVRGDRALYERLTLEAFQSGLSWLTILRKRENFRSAFAGFDPSVVAGFSDADLKRLLSDTGIVRNRAKIEAAIVNARAVVALDGGLTDLIWSHRPEGHGVPAETQDVPATTPESVRLAASLKRQGFVFVGPTTAYATMQATGVVNDHLAGCWVRTDLPDLPDP